jgi:hypothetical protein
VVFGFAFTVCMMLHVFDRVGPKCLQERAVGMSSGCSEQYIYVKLIKGLFSAAVLWQTILCFALKLKLFPQTSKESVFHKSS